MLSIAPLTLNYGSVINRQHPLNRGLVAAYKVLPMRYGGLQWLDLAGSNHGTLTNIGASSATSGWGATTHRGGYGEIRLDGTNDYVSIGDVPKLKFTSSFTIAQWFKNIGAVDAWLVAKSESNFSYLTAYTNDNTPFQFALLVSSNGSTLAIRYSATTLSSNIWYYGVGVYDAGATTLTVYLNGVNDNGTLSGTVPSSIFDSTNNVVIGTSSGVLGEFFGGSVDDVRMYSRALSSSEVAVLYMETQKYFSSLYNYCRLGFGNSISGVASPFEAPMRHGGLVSLIAQ